MINRQTDRKARISLCRMLVFASLTILSCKANCGTQESRSQPATSPSVSSLLRGEMFLGESEDDLIRRFGQPTHVDDPSCKPGGPCRTQYIGIAMKALTWGSYAPSSWQDSRSALFMNHQCVDYKFNAHAGQQISDLPSLSDVLPHLSGLQPNRTWNGTYSEAHPAVYRNYDWRNGSVIVSAGVWTTFFSNAYDSSAGEIVEKKLELPPGAGRFDWLEYRDSNIFLN
jgi:hypothetical protein